MNNLKDKKIAIVRDWLKDFWWAEMVIFDIMNLFPNADIYTSVFFMKDRDIFKNRVVKTSFIQHIPILNKSHKLALTLRPLAFESFDLSEYDIVIASTSAESKGIITKRETLFISYCHTPTRYFWSHYHEYLDMMEFGLLNPIARYMMPKIVHKLRKWDFIAAQRPDYIIANSKNTRSRIKKYYNRGSTVIYPSFNLDSIPFSSEKWDYYFYNGRCIPYKKFDLLVDAFNISGKKLVLVTNTKNKLYKTLKKKSKSNITWYIDISREETNDLMMKSRWFIFPPEEDFGIVPLIAMASGTPVIAYWRWWALETVSDGVSGVFFEDQTPESLNSRLDEFEDMSFDPNTIREYSMKFDTRIFNKNLLEFIDDKLKDLSS